MGRVVAAALHAPVDQVGAAAGDDLAAAHVHGDAHHAVRGHAAGRRHHRRHLGAARLGVEVGAAAALPVQLGLGVVGVGCPSGGREGGRLRSVIIVHTQTQTDNAAAVFQLFYRT